MALLTLTVYVAADAAEAYRAIALSNAEEGNIVAYFRKKKNRQVGREGSEGSFVKTSKLRGASSFYSTVGAKRG